VGLSKAPAAISVVGSGSRLEYSSVNLSDNRVVVTVKDPKVMMGSDWAIVCK
jgi:hypothetical protein